MAGATPHPTLSCDLLDSDLPVLTRGSVRTPGHLAGPVRQQGRYDHTMCSMPLQRRVLVVDDHPLVRDGLVGALTAVGLGWACEGAPDIAQARRILSGGGRVDLVLADQRLPDGDGLDLLIEVLQSAPRTACVLLSGADDVRLAAQARQAGLTGYLSKRLEPAQIVSALQQVLAGGTCFPERAKGAALSFTERQIEVLQHVCGGRTSKEIARELGVSVRTVKDHLTAIFLRLGVSSRAEAVARAAALGLVRLEAWAAPPTVSPPMRKVG
jgi:DNA-binding NarL/FixJ family response regulator